MSLDEKIGQISCYFNLPIGGEMEDVYPDGLERKVFIPGSNLVCDPSSRQLKKYKVLCCPVYAGQHFYAANNCFS